MEAWKHMIVLCLGGGELPISQLCDQLVPVQLRDSLQLVPRHAAAGHQLLDPGGLLLQLRGVLQPECPHPPPHGDTLEGAVGEVAGQPRPRHLEGLLLQHGDHLGQVGHYRAVTVHCGMLHFFICGHKWWGYY